jgi:hypothetical protein
MVALCASPHHQKSGTFDSDLSLYLRFSAMRSRLRIEIGQPQKSEHQAVAFSSRIL